MNRKFLLFYSLSVLFSILLGTLLFYLRVADIEGRDLVFRTLMGTMLTNFALIPILLRLYGREAVWVSLGRVIGLGTLMMLCRVLLQMGACEADIRQILGLVKLTELTGTVCWIVFLTARAIPRWRATLRSYGSLRDYLAARLQMRMNQLRIRFDQKRSEILNRRAAAARSTAEGYAYSSTSDSGDPPNEPPLL